MADVDLRYFSGWVEWTTDPSGALRAELGDSYDPAQFDPESTMYDAAEGAVAEAEEQIWELAAGQARHRLWFEETHWAEWQAGLQYMEGALIFAAFVAWYLENRTEIHRTATHDVLIGLNARGVRVGHEVFALLRSGYAEAAHARWRTLHEIAVVAALVARFGDETANRYRDYGVVELSRELENVARGQRLQKEERRELDALQTKRDELVMTYGKRFASPNGWAANLFDVPPRSITFGHLERMAEAETHGRHKLRAHAHVHASPLAAALNAVEDESRRVFIWGPRSVNLGTPAYLTSRSLEGLSFAAIRAWDSKSDDSDDLACLAAAADELYLSFGLAFTRCGLNVED